jgi:predicted amidohydrolase YtcJ
VRGIGTDKLKLGIVNMVIDGFIQGFTGRLRWPGYASGTQTGIWNVAPDARAPRLAAYLDEAYQVHPHSNGDEATAVLLDAMEEVLGSKPHLNIHTLQHCQMAVQAQFARMKALGLCVKLFSNLLYYWGDQLKFETMGTAERVGVPFLIHSDTHYPVGASIERLVCGQSADSHW